MCVGVKFSNLILKKNLYLEKNYKNSTYGLAKGTGVETKNLESGTQWGLQTFESYLIVMDLRTGPVTYQPCDNGKLSNSF